MFVACKRSLVHQLIFLGYSVQNIFNYNNEALKNFYISPWIAYDKNQIMIVFYKLYRFAEKIII